MKMKELVIGDHGLQELNHCELKSLHGGNPIINYVFGVLKGWAWNLVFSPDQGTQNSHPSAPQNPDGTYICTSDNA